MKNSSWLITPAEKKLKNYLLGNAQQERYSYLPQRKLQPSLSYTTH